MKRQADGELLWGVLVETEAYSQDDPACHGYRRRRPSNETLIEPPVHAPAASEAIRKDYADATYATKVAMGDVFDELAALKSEVAALMAAA